MRAGEFLRAIWPDAGHYVIAIPTEFTGEDGTKKMAYRHTVCKTIDEAIATSISKSNDGVDVFYAVHTFKEAKATDPKSGKRGVRFGFNAAYAKCFILDLDVGDGPNKYPTRQVALAALRKFVTDHNLPKPLLVSSGGGFHVYFLLSDKLDSEKWHAIALRFKLLTAAALLKADPVRTADRSSVLRVVGTQNYKREQPRPVQALTTNPVRISAEAFSLLVESGLQQYGTSRLHNVVTDSQKAAAALLGDNTKKSDYPPLDFKRLALSCKQIGDVVAKRGDVPEPQWYHALQVVRLCDNWRKAAHWMSEGHPSYDPVETDHKLNQLAAKDIAPTTCAKFNEKTDNGICLSCPHWGKIASPARIARAFKEAPAPVYLEKEKTVHVPNPPYPYIRLDSGKIGIKQKNAAGEELDPVILCDYDMYPERRVVNELHDGERMTWRVNLPRSGWRTVELEAGALYDNRAFVAEISKKGIYLEVDMVGAMRNYMIAYIKELQRQTDAERQYSRLGWRDNYSAFVFGNREFLPDGSMQPCSFDSNEKQTIAGVGDLHGSLEAQKASIQFFDKPRYEPHQFCILAALGAILMPATPHNGLIVNMSGDTGVGKSTALKLGASFWGNPAKLAINATSQGSTHLGLMHRLGIYSNLPFLVDEMTRRHHKEIGDFALAISQGMGKIRANVNGGERKNMEQWSTIMLSTANTSFYNILSQDRADSTAETMRVFEIQFHRTGNDSKHDADELLYRIASNYGHVGEEFLKYVVPRRAKVFDLVRQMVRRIDTKIGAEGAERFWSATIAIVLVTGMLAKRIGLIDYDLARLERWALEVQIPSMRSTVGEQYVPSEYLFAEFLEMNISNTLVIDVRNAMPVILEKPKGQLLCRHEYGSNLIYVLKKAFNDYCHKIGANYTKILNEMAADKVLVNRNAKKVLGSGTDFSKGQSHCLLVDLHHPKLAGVAAQVLNVPGSPQVVPAKSNTSK